jgi:protoheme IX farnesyltransferase
MNKALDGQMIRVAGSIGRVDAGRSVLLDHVTLFKPGIVGLVVVATLAGIYLASRGETELSTALWAITGVALATAGSAALNNFFDRDMDSLMERTGNRGLVSGTVSAGYALASGALLTIIAVCALAVFVNAAAALLTGLAAFIYVGLYTLVLKRRSSYANQIGGLAGALPPAIGYAAVTGAVGVEAMMLFLLTAVWQQPHALSLALKYANDYRAASIPVVPVACGVRATKLRILAYTLALMPLSMLPYFAGLAGEAYLAVALAFGASFTILAARFWRSKRDSDMFLFMYSVVYLTAVFLAMVLDMNV